MDCVSGIGFAMYSYHKESVEFCALHRVLTVTA